MNENKSIEVTEEQQICKKCGFCCDGTIFPCAVLQPGEYEKLPEKIKESVFTEKGKDYFRLPCGYFSSVCTIYELDRPKVCSNYRCQLLADYKSGKIAFNDAVALVEEAVEIRNGLLVEYGRLSGKSDAACFRDIMEDLIHIVQQQEINNQSIDKNIMLLARCNIFKAQITRHMESREAFDKLIISNNGEQCAIGNNGGNDWDKRQ